MTDQAWEALSNQAIAAAGVVYFLSLLAYLVQWASLRNVPAAAVEKVAVGAGGPGPDTPDRPAEPRQSQRAAMSGRLDVFHGTNFVLPPTGPAAGVVTVHDLSFLRTPQTVTRASLAYRTLVPTPRTVLRSPGSRSGPR